MGSNQPVRRLAVLKWFNEERGFGFLEPLDGADDVFFHHSRCTDPALLSSGATGRAVSFVAGRDRQGREQAFDVRPE